MKLSVNYWCYLIEESSFIVYPCNAGQAIMYVFGLYSGSGSFTGSIILYTNMCDVKGVLLYNACKGLLWEV